VLQINSRASVTPHITFLVVIQLLVPQIERRNRIGSTALKSKVNLRVNLTRDNGTCP